MSLGQTDLAYKLRFYSRRAGGAKEKNTTKNAFRN